MGRLPLGLLITFQVLLYAQPTHPVTGRRIAPVMGIGGAEWLVRAEREAEEAPEIALDAIGVVKGAFVADLGAGVGYFTWRLAERVGPGGKVYANDIQPEMLRRLKQNIEARRLKNVELVLGTPSDPRLPRAALDLVFMADVYHELSHPREMLRKIHEALKPGGRLVLLEYRKEDPDVPIRPEHKMSEREARMEIEPEGFQFEKNIGVLPRQHSLIFRKLLVQ